MKYLLPTIAAIGVAALGAPTRAQAQQQCDGAAVVHAINRPLTGGRHQVLAPRDSANLPSAARTRRLAGRRVRMADGSVRMRTYVTKSGVPVTKQKPVACTPVPRIPGSAVGEVAPAATPGAIGAPGSPVSAYGEVVPPALPLVGSRFPIPLLGGLLLGGTAIAVGKHTPGSTTTATSTVPTPPVGATPTPPATTPPGGTTPGGTTPGGTTPGTTPTGTTPTGTTPTPPGGTTPTPPGSTSPTPPGTPAPTAPDTTPTPPGTPGTPVPEPATVALVGAGLLLAGGLARRKR